MAKLSLNTIGSRYGSIDALNDNFDAIEAAVENTLSLDGTSPNEMEADLDLNGHDLLNVGEVNTASLRLNGVAVSPSTITYNGVVKETQVATSGQTVFNLSAISYSPLTNNMSVYVDGVYQNPSRYTETSSTRITFSEGLHVGAVVDFQVMSLNELSGTVDSANVTHTQAIAGAVATTVKAKLSEHVSVKDFGAVGDGVTDDTAAIQAAIASGAKSLYFPAGTYYAQIVPTAGLNIVGESYSTVTIKYDGVFVFGTNGSRIDGWTIDNITIDGMGTQDIIGIKAEDYSSKYYIGRNVRINNCGGWAFKAYGGLAFEFFAQGLTNGDNTTNADESGFVFVTTRNGTASGAAPTTFNVGGYAQSGGRYAYRFLKAVDGEASGIAEGFEHALYAVSSAITIYNFYEENNSATGDITHLEDCPSAVIIGGRYSEAPNLVWVGTATADRYIQSMSRRILSVGEATAKSLSAATVSVPGLGFNATAFTKLTIASGVITATNIVHAVDTEGGAATDNLDTISAGVPGQLLIIQSSSNTRDIVVKNLTGNIRLSGAADFTLANQSTKLMLMYNTYEAYWDEVSRSVNS